MMFVEALENVPDSSMSSGTFLAIAAAGLLLLVAFRGVLYAFPKRATLPSAHESAQIYVPTMSGVVTKSELKDGTGADGKALLIAVKDPFSESVSVFDVSAGRDFYGPGGPYHVFAGKHATYGLAKSSTDPEKVSGDLSELSAHEKDTHMQWYAKYASKYPIVGVLVSDGAKVTDDTESAITSDTKKDA